MAEERHICALRRQGCGGCPLLETPYPEQLRQKQARVEALLGEFGPVSPILGMEHPWHYRNKAISTFCTGPGRRLDSGIYAAGTHRVVPVASCLLHHPALDEAVEAVRRAARLCRYEPYQEDRGTGLVRHVLVRHSRATGRVLVALVTAAPVLPGARAFVSKVRELCPQVETIVQNINPRRSSAVLGPREKVLWGRGYIEDTLCGVRFRLGASSFYQINPEQTEVLYRTALDGAGLDGTQTVVDAYCGVGTIGLEAAGRARRVLGGEFNPSAARCAAQNARANGAGNARFLCADATAYLQGMAARGERADVVFLDPPRAGSTPEFLGAVDRMGADRLHLLQPGDAAAGSPPAGRMGVEGPAAPAGGSLSPYGACGVCGGAGQNPRRWYVRYAASEVKTAWEPGAQRAAPGSHFTLYATLPSAAWR